MLEIDYSLFPLSEEEHEQISARAESLARRGKAPPLSPASYGRVVVINPYEGHTLHHVPDDLRRPLRRAMLPVYKASKALTGGQLVKDILESTEEQVYQVVFELYSKFPHALSFLREISRVKKKYPQCRLLMHGEMVRFQELLKEILSENGASCDLLFDHFEGAISLRSVDQIENVLAELPRYPTVSKPFFSHLHISQGDKGQNYSFEELRHLYRQFGVGHIEELDISGKLRQKLIILDIPLSAIKFLRIAPGRGDGISAINLDGRKVLPSEIAAMGLLDKDIPISYVKSVYRKTQGKAEEQILLDRVRALRINCIEGHVSFLWKPTARYIPLYEVKGMRVQLGKSSAGNGGEAVLNPPPDNEVLTIENAVITEQGQPRFGDIRAEIRQRFLENVFQENLERQVKLQRYVSSLKIACLGPMAAQTIRLLRPYGLGQFIPQESLYYLCDSVEQIPDYYRSDERVERLYDEIVGNIKDLFGFADSGEIQPDLINHRLPVIQEWARGEVPLAREVTAEQLDVIYKEMKIYLSFVENEFRRIKANDETDKAVFGTVERCQATLLQVGQLANLIGGRYGKLPDRQSFPDFVFFSSDKDTLENRRSYYLPGLAFSGVFGGDEIQEMFRSNDFEFSVFLEEQLALADYVKSQDYDGQYEAGFYGHYFEGKAAEAEKELEKFQQTAESVKDPSTDQYREEVERMAEHHRAEVEAYRKDRERQVEILNRRESNYFAALGAVNAYLGDVEFSSEQPESGEDYIRALDQQLIDKSKELLGEFKELVRISAESTNLLVQEKKESLTAYLLAFSKAQKALYSNMKADYGVVLEELYRAGLPEMLDKLTIIARISDDELEAAESNLRRRTNALKSEMTEIADKVNRNVKKNQQTMVAIREATRRLVASISSPVEEKLSEDDPAAVVAKLKERLEFVKRETLKIIAAAEASYETVQGIKSQQRSRCEKTVALHIGDNEQAMIEARKGGSRLERFMAKKVEKPLLPALAFGDRNSAGGLSEQARIEIAAWREEGDMLREFSGRALNLEDIGKELETYQEFEKVSRGFRRAVREKTVTQQATARINERLEQLEQERENIDQFVQECMLPAHANYAERVHIPNLRKRIAYFRQTLTFVQALQGISFSDLQRKFLDRAIFRRFYATQFRTGAHFGLNSELPIFSRLSNITDALSLFHRNLLTTLRGFGYDSNELTLTRLPAERPAGVIQFIEQQKQASPEQRLTYLILPGTLSLSQALEIIHHKEDLYNGLPQLVLIYVSKFDAALLHENPILRERYFDAMKHNIIVNIDDEHVIDNPKTIADFLIEQTLGCCHDINEDMATSMDIDKARGGVA
ncbi:MAG: hypothetical protein O7B79_14650 [SAR324 cluster bacterium]|nr:hypothetical protein [SAR324 cluster bacterium]